MAFPVVESRSTSQSAIESTSHTVDLPSGITTGDLLIVVFGMDNNDGSVTWPSGWTEITGAAVDADNRSRGFAIYRVVVGDEGFTGTGDTVTVTTSISDESAHASLMIVFLITV